MVVSSRMFEIRCRRHKGTVIWVVLGSPEGSPRLQGPMEQESYRDLSKSSGSGARFKSVLRTSLSAGDKSYLQVSHA